jgi:hypothetical protein
MTCILRVHVYIHGQNASKVPIHLKTFKTPGVFAMRLQEQSWIFQFRLSFPMRLEI